MMRNKDGQVVLDIFTFLAAAFVFVLIVGTFLYAFIVINEELDQDIPVGQVNLSDATQLTFGKFTTAFMNGADLLALFFIFGMILAIMLGAFLTRDKQLSVLLVFDFILMIFGYIMAVYISNQYEDILKVLPFAYIFTNHLNVTSTLMLYLPRITVIVSSLAMILAYAGIPKTKEEQIAGF